MHLFYVPISVDTSQKIPRFALKMKGNVSMRFHVDMMKFFVMMEIVTEVITTAHRFVILTMGKCIVEMEHVQIAWDNALNVLSRFLMIVEVVGVLNLLINAMLAQVLPNGVPYLENVFLWLIFALRNVLNLKCGVTYQINVKMLLPYAIINAPMLVTVIANLT